MAYITTIFWSKLAALVLGCAVMSTLACSPLPTTAPGEEEPSMLISSKVNQSDIVAIGRVTSTELDTKGPKDWEVSTVNFEVQCVFKGAPLKQSLTIKNVGHIPGLCYNTALNEGYRYMVYLKKMVDGTIQPIDATQDEIQENLEEGFIDELSTICGIQTTFPTDVKEGDRESKCVGTSGSLYTLQDCQEAETPKPATNSPAPKPTTNSPAPKPTTNSPTTEEEQDEVDGSPSEVDKDNNMEKAQGVKSSDKTDNNNSANSRCISTFGVISLVLAYFIM